MTTKARYNEVKTLVRRCISIGMKKPEIIAKVKAELDFRIIPATYPRIVNSIREDQATDNLSLDLEIQSRWDLLEKVINKDLQTENIKDRASVLRNAITLNKEKLEFYIKTGKIDKATDNLSLDLEIQSRWDLLEKVINKDLQADNVKDRAIVTRNGITLNKEKLEFYLKTGKIARAADKVEIEHTGTINLRDKMKAIQDYIMDKDKEKGTENISEAE